MIGCGAGVGVGVAGIAAFPNKACKISSDTGVALMSESEADDKGDGINGIGAIGGL